jgi:hypothetical protein
MRSEFEKTIRRKHCWSDKRKKYNYELLIRRIFHLYKIFSINYLKKRSLFTCSFVSFFVARTLKKVSVYPCRYICFGSLVFMFCFAVNYSPSSVLASDAVQRRMDEARKYYEDCIASGGCAPSESPSDPAGALLQRGLEGAISRLFGKDELWKRQYITAAASGQWVPDDGREWMSIVESRNKSQVVEMARRYVESVGNMVVFRHRAGHFVLAAGLIDRSDKQVWLSGLARLSVPVQQVRFYKGHEFIGVVYAGWASLKPLFDSLEKTVSDISKQSVEIIDSFLVSDDASKINVADLFNPYFQSYACVKSPFPRSRALCYGLLNDRFGAYVGWISKADLK